jgi:hypothetical protein
VNEPFRRVKDEDLDDSYLKKFGKNAFDAKVRHCFVCVFI